ncbi:MAG: D-alanyl-D-alanine carboxypeptidase [Gammaproteobacteria bacterium]|nr:D-alanyl-D-alanine carboxypeptidase [Gammaproteobacteria bacterium]
MFQGRKPSMRCNRSMTRQASGACLSGSDMMIRRLPISETAPNPGRRHLLAFRIALVLTLLVCSAVGRAELADMPDIMKFPSGLPEIGAKSWILADFNTGWVLGGENIDQRMEPASLTKLMTSYLVFEALKTGRLKEDDPVFVSHAAWKAVGSRMYIEVNTQVSVIDLLKGLIIQSGNDAALALAEHLGGTEKGFAERMNRKAAELGMRNTRFQNSSGLPEPDHYSTLRDMTLLAISLIRDFPEYYKLYSELEYTYNGITQQNRNVLLTRDSAVDGIKTGYTRNAGYCLIGTANRDGFRLVAGVMGSRSRAVRANEVHSLMRFGYSVYEGVIAFKSNSRIASVPLWLGREREAPVGVSRNLGIPYPKGTRDKLSVALELPEGLEAPLPQGQEVGHIRIKFDGKKVYGAPLHVLHDHAEGPWYRKIMDRIIRFAVELFD